MENKTDILNELKMLSPVVAGLEKVNVFSVPEGYFDQLSTDILTGVATEYNQVESIPVAEQTGEVPSGYFDSLADQVMSKIKAQQNDANHAEEIKLSSELQSIRSIRVFEVPVGYFDNLDQQILEKIKRQPKVVRMPRRLNAVMKYAVAAVFTGIMALGVFKFTANNNAAIELPEYVTAGLQVENIDKELAKISDVEIVKFLKASGTDVEAAFVANSIDHNDLPSQVDYLLDDQALDKYLENIHIDELTN